jgi:hypothetical protein
MKRLFLPVVAFSVLLSACQSSPEPERVFTLSAKDKFEKDYAYNMRQSKPDNIFIRLCEGVGYNEHSAWTCSEKRISFDNMELGTNSDFDDINPELISKEDKPFFYSGFILPTTTNTIRSREYISSPQSIPAHGTYDVELKITPLNDFMSDFYLIVKSIPAPSLVDNDDPGFVYPSTLSEFRTSEAFGSNGYTRKSVLNHKFIPSTNSYFFISIGDDVQKQSKEALRNDNT